jgi:predicted ribosome quality control (RQC) complex YloA/Tae2 family protein
VAILPTEVLAALETAVDEALRRCTSLEAELDRAEDPDTLRARGDLLLARLDEFPAGSEEVTLEGFDGRLVSVHIDPRLSGPENAAAYYDRASRSARARERLPTLLSRARTEAHRLEELLDRARAGDAGAAEIRGALPEAPLRGRGPPRASAALPYHRYVSSGGLEIRVGRGAGFNDDLTFRHSAPDDVWLHARHAAGAHVILRWGKPGSPPRRDLEEAAVLAAVNSKARTAGSVPVDWTFRKYVRKPRGTPPGTVVPQRVRTVFVAPDPDVAERLTRP